MASIIYGALQEALETIGQESKYKILESPSYDLFPSTILDASETSNTLKIIGAYDELFEENSEAIEVINSFEMSYEVQTISNLSIDLTVSFLGELLKKTGLGKAEVSAIFADGSNFNLNLSSVFGLAANSRQLRKYQESKTVNTNSAVAQMILDNPSSEGYLVSEVLSIREFSLTSKTRRGATVNLDASLVDSIFKKLLRSETTEDSTIASIKSKFEWSVEDNKTLKLKFPQGLTVGVTVVYFGIVNKKITFKVSQLTQEKMIAKLKDSLIQSDVLSPIFLV